MMSALATGIGLNELKVREQGRIVHLDAEPKEAAKLIALGILPGLQVTILQRIPSYVFAIGHTQFAVDLKMAKQIRVERIVIGIR